MHEPAIDRRGKWRLSALLVALALLLAGCTDGDADAFEGEPSDHALAHALLKARPYLEGLDGTERAAVDTFIRTANSRTSSFEIRRICSLSGKALGSAQPTVVADFVYESADYLYDDFFLAFDDATLAQVANALRSRPGADETAARRYGSIVTTARNGYKGPLSKAVGIVLFADAVEPRPIPREDLMPAEDDPVEIWNGAAEIIRLKGFVKEGPRVDLSVELYEKALKKWPDDVLLLAGLVTLYVEYEDRYPNELRAAIRRAADRDLDNAAYDYLLAARAFRVGEDDEALRILKSMEHRKVMTFHSLERARRVVAALERAGYGALRARLTAYRSISLAPYFDIKDLANRSILRSQEYEAEKRADAVKTVLQFPYTLSKQISASPRLHHVERIRARIVAVGMSRCADWYAKSDLAKADELRQMAVQAEARVRTLEKGEEIGAGRVAWGQLNDLLGEEKFMLFVENVLFGNEADFLARCAEKKGIEEVVDFATDKYPFE